MASTELISSIAKPKKKYTFGQRLGDAGLATARNAFSGIPGLDQIITDDMFTSEKMADVSGTISGILSPIKQMALSAATGGLGGVPAGPTSFAKGGLRTFEGNTHEQGGIKLGADEVEMGETMMPMDAQSDFIFSDRLSPIKSVSPKGKITYSNKTFAQKSKEINKPVDLRPNDPYAKKTADIKLKKLAQEQEMLKGVTMESTTNHMAMGGKRYFDGGGRNRRTISGKSDSQLINPISTKNLPAINVQLEDEGYIDDIPSFDTVPSFNYTKMFQDYDNAPITVPEATFGMYNDNFTMTPLKAQVDPTAGKFKSNPLIPSEKSSAVTPYQSNFLIPALGYAAQAATNIPALFTKPDTINSSRVKFDRINLAEQRNEARRSRNLGLATARGIGATDAGQMMNYLSGTTAGLNSLYGNQFNQSLLQEQQANAEMNMREQLANSEIERYDEQINAQERDTARALRMNALQNLGTIAAGAGKDYMAMQENDNMVNILRGSNPDFTYDIVDGKLVPVRIKAYGGKRRKV